MWKMQHYEWFCDICRASIMAFQCNRKSLSISGPNSSTQTCNKRILNVRRQRQGESWQAKKLMVSVSESCNSSSSKSSS